MAMYELLAVPGLVYVPDYLSMDEQADFLHEVDSQPWMGNLKRRVQHYGYEYDYRARTVTPEAYLGPLPSWAQPLAERLHGDDYIHVVPDQIIVNEYEPGQGIARHVDCEPCFGDTILSITLGSACMMVYTEIETRYEVPVLLEPGSLVVMKGPSRTDWMHGIPARKTDEINGQTIRRGRRVSLTFREVVLA